jgi:hypothetical protein
MAQAVVPDPTLTPGAVRTTDVGDICSHGTGGLRHWSRERDDRIMAEYGLPPGPHSDFEIDHLIPLCLGGADEDANLWPEPRRSIEKEWPAELKDDLDIGSAKWSAPASSTSRRRNARSQATGPSRTSADSGGWRDDWRVLAADWLAKTS